MVPRDGVLEKKDALMPQKRGVIAKPASEDALFLCKPPPTDAQAAAGRVAGKAARSNLVKALWKAPARLVSAARLSYSTYANSPTGDGCQERLDAGLS
ncbi:hypothetical protein MRX96_054527 [Rhipicephalus microplus]